MAFEHKKKAAPREPTYGEERSIANIAVATDELSSVLRRSRDSAQMREIIRTLRQLQGQAAAAVVAED